MKDKKKPYQYLYLNPVDFGIWEPLEQNVYQGQKITSPLSLKENIVQEWNKISQEILNKYMHVFKPRLRCVNEVEGWHTEAYWLLIIHRGIYQYVFAKSRVILINQKSHTISVKLNFQQPQSQKLFSSWFINAVHLTHAPIMAEQNNLQCVLYQLSIFAAPSTDKVTFMV